VRNWRCELAGQVSNRGAAGGPEIFYDAALGRFCAEQHAGDAAARVSPGADSAEKNNFDPVGVLAYAGDRRFSEALQVAILGRDYPALVRMYVERALSPDTTDLFAFLSFLYEHRIPLADIYDLVLRPGMQEIGELWANGRIGISHEHRASYETMDALAKLQTEIVLKPPAGKHVLCACLGEELHEIGLRCASNLFESEGWKVHYLGARTPVDAIIASLHEVRPDVVSLSITSAGPHIAHELAAIAGAVQSIGGRMIIGGAGAARVLSGSGVEATVLQSSGEIIDYIGTISGGVHAAGIPQA